MVRHLFLFLYRHAIEKATNMSAFDSLMFTQKNTPLDSLIQPVMTRGQVRVTSTIFEMFPKVSI